LSNFAERGQKVKRQAADERGVYVAHGAPANIYAWWKRNGGTTFGSRENFCHYWRVVVFWAPLKAIVKTVKRFAVPLLALLALAVIAALVIICGTVGFLKGLLVFLAVLAIAASGVLVAAGIEWLFDKYWPRRWNKVAAKIAIGALALAVVALIVDLVVTMIANSAWIALTVFFVIFVGLPLVGWGLIHYLGGYFDEREREQNHREWLIETGELPAPEPKQPNRVQRFFKGVGEFVFMFAQIVLARKTKICPWVDVEV